MEPQFGIFEENLDGYTAISGKLGSRLNGPLGNYSNSILQCLLHSRNLIDEAFKLFGKKIILTDLQPGLKRGEVGQDHDWKR